MRLPARAASALWPGCYFHLGLVLLAILGSGCTAESPTPPNILLIVVDDLGYNDLGANGNNASPTPQLNALAAEGIRYTRHYAHASCSVARVGLLTGGYPARHGFRPVHLGLSADTKTLASALRDRGYRTHHIGKWHVGNPTAKQSPLSLGFDSWFGFLLQSELGGVSDDGIHFNQPTYLNPWLRTDNQAPEQHRGHLTDILSARAASFITEHSGRKQPWFLNLWYYAPHVPLMPARRYLEQFPESDARPYLALLKQLDTGLGQVLDALDDSEQRQNTLVILLSDNGGTNRQLDNNYPFSGKKTQFMEGGLRTPLLMRWPQRIDAGRVSDELVSIYDIFPTATAATGARLPATAIGRDLLTGDDLPGSPPLFWEYSNSSVHRYSALSSDGRWRLSRGSYRPPALYDLNNDPGTQHNLIAQRPDMAAQLEQQYLDWHLQQREIPLHYESLGENGEARLSGSDLQRSPGYSGFTFAIAATPLPGANPEREMIAYQAGRWQINHSHSGGLQVRILGQTLTAPPLPAGTCSDIVVTTHYRYSPRNPGNNSAILDLYVNRDKVDSRNIEHPVLHHENYGSPTFLGMDDSGQRHFAGRLGRPILINERVIIEPAQGLTIGNSITGLPSTCTTPEH